MISEVKKQKPNQKTETYDYDMYPCSDCGEIIHLEYAKITKCPKCGSCMTLLDYM